MNKLDQAAALEALAVRVEAAGPHEQHAVLIEAYQGLHGIYPDASDWTQPHEAKRFRRMLDAEAFESAAMSLVPEGWYIRSLSEWTDRSRACVELSPANRFIHSIESRAATPALALTAAPCRAHAAALRSTANEGRPTPEEHQGGAYDPDCPDCRAYAGEGVRS